MTRCRLLTARALVALLALALGPWAQAAPGRIYSEAWLSNPRPFVKEPLLYTVRVYSSIDLRTLQVIPPVVNDATLERVDEDALTGGVTLDGTRYVTSDIRYVVTPMQGGNLHIGPARITVAYGGRPGSTQAGEETFHTQPLKLEVREAKALEHDWQPLQWLDMKASLDAPDEPRVGQPLVLSIDIRARGSRGDQLPSVATQLAVPGFKVYPERPRVDTRIQQPGHIWGRRVESYTVIPTRDGQLEIPEITVHWWDLNRQQEVTGRLPPRALEVLPALARDGGDAAADDEPVPEDPASGIGSFFLMVLVAIAGGYGLFWLLGDAGGGQLRFQRLRDEAAARWRAGLAAAAGLVRRLWWRLVRFLDRVTPFALQYAWWRRAARRAAGADDLRGMLSAFAAVRLDLAPTLTLHHLGERLAAGASAEEAELIRHLVRQLDDAFYGRRPLDLEQWQEEWEQVLGGILSRTHRPRRAPPVTPAGRRHLPELNP